MKRQFIFQASYCKAGTSVMIATNAHPSTVPIAITTLRINYRENCCTRDNASTLPSNMES